MTLLRLNRMPRRVIAEPIEVAYKSVRPQIVDIWCGSYFWKETLAEAPERLASVQATISHNSPFRTCEA